MKDVYIINNMRHSKYLGVIQIDKSITKTLDDDDISTILTYCTDALERYWGLCYAFTILMQPEQKALSDR